MQDVYLRRRGPLGTARARESGEKNPQGHLLQLRLSPLYPSFPNISLTNEMSFQVVHPLQRSLSPSLLIWIYENLRSRFQWVPLVQLF